MKMHNQKKDTKKSKPVVEIIPKKPIKKRNDTITSDDILGKDAIDPEGAILGVVVKLHINIKSKQITGITIDQGFMKPNLFVGIDFIKHYGIDTVLLNAVPTDTYKGMNVITEDGKSIGIVKDVKLKKSKIKTLIIKPIGFSFKKTELEIPSTQILEISSSVILKKQYNEIKD